MIVEILVSISCWKIRRPTLNCNRRLKRLVSFLFSLIHEDIFYLFYLQQCGKCSLLHGLRVKSFYKNTGRFSIQWKMLVVIKFLNLLHKSINPFLPVLLLILVIRPEASKYYQKLPRNCQRTLQVS